MLYKELISVRSKLALWAAVYLGLALLLNTIWHPSRGISITWNTPLYTAWLNLTGIITPLMAVLGGADLVSEEVDKGTLSFLLTRPVSRFQIYSTKIGLNVAGLIGVYALSSLLMLFIDRFQTTPSELWGSLAYTGLVMVGGVCVICLGGLVSVYTRNILQTIGLTMLIPLFIVALGALTFWFVLSFFIKDVVLAQLLPPQFLWLLGTVLPPLILISFVVGLISFTSGLFVAGLYSFTRKEF